MCSMPFDWTVDENALRPFVGCYRTYSDLDLIEWMEIDETLTYINRNLKNINLMSMLAQVKDHTIFSLFKGSTRLYNKVREILETSGFENMEGED